MMLTINEPITVGDTPAFTLNALKNGVVWDLTGATVTLDLWAPDGTHSGPFTATLSNPSGGVAYYVVDNTVLSSVGDWVRKWTCVQGSMHLSTARKTFSVEA